MWLVVFGGFGGAWCSWRIFACLVVIGVLCGDRCGWWCLVSLVVNCVLGVV